MKPLARVYIAVNYDEQICKIGFTRGDLRSYISGLEHSRGTALDLYGCAPGGREVERLFHRSLKPYRKAHGEWFRFDSDIEAKIKALLDEHGGVIGWPAEPASPTIEPHSWHEPVLPVPLLLPGFAPISRPKRLVRRQLDGSDKPLPTTAETGEVDYYTPAAYVESARRVMGRIDLDPASCEEVNKKAIRATVFYGKDDNSLALEWTGNIFLNPPWSGHAKGFVRALLTSYRSGSVRQAILVLNAEYTDRSYMREVLHSFPVCFTNHRVRYGGLGKQPTAGTIFVYLGPYQQRFVDEFSQYGPVMLRLISSGEMPQ